MGAFQWERLLPLACYVDLSAILPDYVRAYGIAGARELLQRFGAQRDIEQKMQQVRSFVVAEHVRPHDALQLGAEMREKVWMAEQEPVEKEVS